MAFETIKEITTIDDKVFSLHIFSPTEVEYHKSNCKGVILAVHGLAEHRGRYNQLAEITCNKNKIFANFNVRGHGINTTKKGDVQNLSCLILDIIQVFNTLKELFPNIKKNSFTLFGHSFGGVLVTYAASVLGQELKKLFLSSPGYSSAEEIPPWKILLANNMAHYFPKLGIPIGIDANSISHNPENNKNYKNDPLVLTHVTARFGQIILSALSKGNLINAIGKISAEVTIIIPGDDELVDSNYTKEIVTLFPSPVNAIEIKGAGHEAFNEGESIRKIAFSHYETWLDSI